MRDLRFFSVTLAAALAVTAAQAQTVDAARAVVTDHAASHVSIVDLATGQVLRRFDTGSPGGLRHGAAIGEVSLAQGPAGRVDLVRLGIALEGHGDHADLRLSDPELIPRIAEGPRPSHVLGGDGRVASFFDGDGSIVVFESGASRRLSANVPHHGLAFPFRSSAGRRLLISHAQAPGDRPGGVVILDDDARESARRDDCPRLHGEAISGSVIGLGCADGVLLLNTRSQEFRKVPYPASAAAELMVRNLIGGVDFQLFVGDFGPAALVVLDPDAPSFRVVDLPGRRLAFSMDPKRAADAFALTEDGRVHRINTLTGSIVASAQATHQYSMEGGSAVARPRMSVAGGLIAITDPARSRLLVLDAEGLATLREVAVGGVPLNVVAVAATGDLH